MLTGTFLLLMAALACAELLSRRFVSSLDRVREVSTGMPSKIVANQAIEWPESMITETDALVQNFGELTGTLVRQLADVKGLNDILEKRVSERTLELQESENRFRMMANSAPVLLWISGRDKLCTFFNQQWLDFTGRTLEQEWGNGWAEGVHADDFDRCLQIYVEAFDARRPFQMEYRLRRHDGQYRWIVDSGIPRYEGDSFAGYIGACTDIHDIRTAQEALQQMTVEKGAILDTLTVGVSFIRDRVVQWSNAAHDHIFGFRPGGSSGIPTSSLYADEEDYLRVGQTGYAALARGKTFTAESRMKRADGSFFWCILTGRALNPQRPDEGSIWMMQDITESRESQEALREKTDQLEALTRSLEDRVQQETALRMKNEQVMIQQSKLAAMGEMLGAIAHQWRQPLNTLGLCVQNIEDAFHHGSLSEPYLQRTVGKSLEQLEHMSKTIDDFRNFFRPDKELSRFNTMEAVAHVLSLFTAHLASNSISCTVSCSDHGLTFGSAVDVVACPDQQIVGYRNEFEHVIMNIVGNARDAIVEKRRMREGQTAAEGLIAFDFTVRGESVIIVIRDSGTGIADGILPRIFEPYFTMKGESKGTGIGLYMSKVIIEEHMGGSLTAGNTPEGAIFTIRLKAAERRQADD